MILKCIFPFRKKCIYIFQLLTFACKKSYLKKMADGKQQNNLEETDLDLDKIIKRIKELHIKKTVSSNGSVSKNPKLAAVDNLKQVFNEVINEEENKVVNNDVKKSILASFGYELRDTPSRQNSKVFVNKIKSQKNEFLEQEEIIKPSAEVAPESLESSKRYLRNTPSRNVYMDSTQKQYAQEEGSLNRSRENNEILDSGNTKMCEEIPVTLTDRYELRNTPSRMSRKEIEEQNSESPTRQNQDTIRDPYDLRNTPSRMNRESSKSCAENGESLAVDENNIEKIGEMVVDESQFGKTQALTHTETRADNDEDPITFLKIEKDSALESCSLNTTTTNMYKINHTEYPKQSEGKVDKLLFRCASSNESNTQHAKKQISHQRFGFNSKEASFGRCSPKTYRLFNDSSASKNVSLKSTSSYSSPNLRMVAISNQATSKFSSQEVPPKGLTPNRVTPKSGRSFENGSPMNDRVAKSSPNSKRNDKKCTNIGRTPFREKSQILQSNQSFHDEDGKLKKQFTVGNLKENRTAQNF